MGNRSKYRKLPELFVVGKEVVFETEDGPLVMWVQVLNPFEQQECRNQAQAARGRMVMALKTPDSPEQMAAKSAFMQRTPREVTEDLASGKYTEWYLNAQNALETDPEWKERMDVLRNADEAPGTPLTEEEEALLAQLNSDFMVDLNRRINEDAEYFKSNLAKLSEEDLLQEYLDTWRTNRGQSVALIEYNVSETFYGTRVCDAQPDPEGTFTAGAHSGCNQHKERVFEAREEVRDLPGELQERLREAFDDLNMTVREAKNSARQGSSSDSPPLPKPEEESTPSTSTAVLQVVPGI